MDTEHICTEIEMVPPLTFISSPKEFVFITIYAYGAPASCMGPNQSNTTYWSINCSLIGLGERVGGGRSEYKLLMPTCVSGNGLKTTPI